LSRAVSLQRIRKKEIAQAYLFLAPTLAGFFIFILGPMAAAMGLAFFDWNLISPPTFAALHNYYVIFSDPRVLKIIWNTLFFTIVSVGVKLVLALLLALGVHSQISRFSNYFLRTTIFSPVVISMAAASVMLGWMLNTDFGIVNHFVRKLGIMPIKWLTSSTWSMRSIILIDIWKTIGFYFIVFLAGLHNIPKEFYEAAKVDGANAWHQFWYVSLPGLTPTLFFLLVIGLSSALQVFDQAYILTRGGPGDSTRVLVYYLYEHGFQYLNMGYASTLAVVLFLFVLILTIFQFRLGRFWVFYQ